MKNYFKQLINKTNIFSNSLIGIIFFIFYKLLVDNELFDYLKSNKIIYYSYFTLVFLLVILSYLFVQIKKINVKDVDINDNLVVIYTSFFIMNFINSILNFQSVWNIIFNIGLILINFLILYHRAKRIGTYLDEDLEDNSEQKGNFVNYYYSLFRRYNIGFGLIISFTLFAFYNYFNIYNIVINKNNLIPLIIIASLLALILFIETMKNYRNKNILYLDFLYFIFKIFSIIILVNSLLDHEDVYQIILVCSMLLIFIIMTVSRYKYVLRDTIDEDDVFINKKKGLKIYTSHYLQKFGAFSTIIYSIFINAFLVFTLYSNISTYLFKKNNELYEIVSLFIVAINISILFIQLQNISSKNVSYSDFITSITFFSFPSLIYIYISRKGDFLYNFDYIVFFSACILVLFSFINLLLRLRYVFDEEIIEVKEIIAHNLEKENNPILNTNNEQDITKTSQNDDKIDTKELVTEDENKKDDQLSVNLLTQSTLLSESKEIETESKHPEENNNQNQVKDENIKIIDITNLNNEYDEYFKLIKDKYSANQIKLNDFNNENNHHILISVFINFSDIKKFDLYLESYMKRAKDLNMMGLNSYDSFAIDYLLSLEPTLAIDLKNVKEVLLPNNYHSFYNRIKISQPKQYKERRAELLKPILNKYNENICTILYYIFSEIRYCINEKVTKDLVKIEKGRIQSNTYFDLYLRDYDFDFNKAKRQVTKFSEEYNKATSISDSSKCFKEFVNSIPQMDYFPTILTILDHSLSIFKDREKLLIDILKKLNLFYNAQYSQIEGIDKIAEIVKDIVLSFPKKDFENSIKIIFENTNDIYFLDKVINKFKENYGNKNSMINLLQDNLKVTLKRNMDYNDNLFERKKLTKEEYHIIINYLKTDDSFINYLKSSINEKTIYNYLSLYINVRKTENNYIYEFDYKSYTDFISKPEIIKLIKNNDKNSKQQVFLDIIKNKGLESKTKIQILK